MERMKALMEAHDFDGLYVIFQRIGDWFEPSSFRRSASSSAG